MFVLFNSLKVNWHNVRFKELNITSVSELTFKFCTCVTNSKVLSLIILGGFNKFLNPSTVYVRTPK